MRQWRLADGCASATPAGSVANAGTNACSGTAAVRRLHHARSVPGHGRRLLRKWRLDNAAARWNTAGADTGPDARANADTGARTLRRMHDARSVRRDGRRLLRERWLAYAAAHRSAGTAADSDAHASSEWMHRRGSVRGYWRRRLRERWMDSHQSDAVQRLP